MAEVAKKPSPTPDAQPGPAARVTWPDEQESPRRHAASSIDVQAHSPPQLSSSTPTPQGSCTRPFASPSVVGMYDFAWDESPALRESPRNRAFNHRSLFNRGGRSDSSDSFSSVPVRGRADSSDSFSAVPRPRKRSQESALSVDAAMADSPRTRTRLNFDMGFDAIDPYENGADRAMAVSPRVKLDFSMGFDADPAPPPPPPRRAARDSPCPHGKLLSILWGSSGDSEQPWTANG